MRGWTLMTAVVLVGLPCSLTRAQNALGDGRALDNNLSTTSRINRQRTSFRQELAFRNSIVTGNAPGGLSFRGDVGYLAPGEFSGDELGSNDLFAFRRDSLQSGIAGMGIRGTEALQYQLSLTTGSRPPANLVGRYSVSRSGAGSSGFDLGSTGRVDPAGATPLQQRPALDPDADDRGTMLWMLRSPSAFISNSALQTSALRHVRANDQVYTLTASPLRGVRLSPVPDLTSPQGQGDPNSRTEPGEDDESSGIDGRAPGSGNRPGGSDTDSESRRSPNARDRSREVVRVQTLHGDIMRRLIEADQERQQADLLGGGPRLDVRMRQLVDRLRGRSAEDQERREIDPSEVDEDNWALQNEPETLRDSRRITFDPETIQLLRGDGTPINRYVYTQSEHRNFYAEHLKAGQELMAKGRYFDAEERFAHALGVLRGDVTAQMARLHAQIGAGLFLSASLNMHTLAYERPELFAARYAEELLPSRDRLEELVVLFQNTIDKEHPRHLASSPSIRKASALLLAYVGHQLQRDELIEQGLDDYLARSMEGLEPGEPLPIEARLEALFRALWLDAGGGPGDGGPGDVDG